MWSRKLSLGWVLGICLSLGPLAAQEEPAPITRDMTLDELIQRVLARNESVQVRVMELEISRRKYRAERGIFEPEMVLGYEHQDNQREITSQDPFRLRPGTYEERNNLYNAGLETLVPTGARVRLGYSLRDLRNNQHISPMLARLSPTVSMSPLPV